MNINLSAPITTTQKMINGMLAQLPNIALGLVVFFLFLIAGSILKGWIRKLIHGRRHRKNLGLLMGRLTQLLMVIIGTFIACGIVFPSVNAQSIIQALGIGSVAIGFAFRDVLQNFLAGVLILINEPFAIGDRIKFKEFEGIVEDILARATFIRTQDGKRVVVPNSVLFTEPIVIGEPQAPELNLRRDHHRRLYGSSSD